MCRSVRQTPQACTSSSTCPGPGSGSGSSAGRSGVARPVQHHRASSRAMHGERDELWATRGRGLAARRRSATPACAWWTAAGSSAARRRAGRALLDGHIPGAAFLDLDDDLSGPAGRARPPPAARRRALSGGRAARGDLGRHAASWPTTRPERRRRTPVVAAAPLRPRRRGGARRRAAAWRAAEARSSAGPRPSRAAGDFTVHARTDDTADAEEIAAAAALSLVDARAPERFAGETRADRSGGGAHPRRGQPAVCRAGARRALSTPGGAAGALARAAGDDELVAYCGSGVTACTLVLAAEVAGRPARLYPGSWSEWCARGGPAETDES